MSWFVLNPPKGIRVVSFFITARLASQEDRAAFIENVLEQLATLLDEPMPAFLTESTKDAHLLGMLSDAADACRARGERLVLVVDGLDEDRGATGPHAYSIAALLPDPPPADMRIIIAGRPNPPIPADVPEHHQLRERVIVNRLTASPYAAVVRNDMERDLKRLLLGSQAEQDLLGLLTAARGGLSGPDLAELTGMPDWQVDDELRAVAARSFSRRPSRWAPGIRPEVYVLGHEELLETAKKYLGNVTLSAYQQRLHIWVDKYRERGWPEDTPEYLLQGYYRMLIETSDLKRIIACATDQARHDWMLDITGGDFAALTEIAMAQDLLLRSGVNLAAIGRLAVHRASLAERNANIPTSLAIVWDRLGHPERAEALAYAISSPHGSADESNRQAKALTALAQLALKDGEIERAELLTKEIRSSDQRADMQAQLAQTAANSGDFERAEAIIIEITDPLRQAESLARLAWTLDSAGDPEHSVVVAQLAEMGANAIDDPSLRATALCGVAKIAAAAGDVERAEAIGNSISYPSQRGDALFAAAEAAARSSDVERAVALAENAEQAARAIADPRSRLFWFAFRAEPLAVLAEKVAAVGNLDQAIMLAQRSATSTPLFAELNLGNDLRTSLLAALRRVLATFARVAVGTGRIESAEALAGSTPKAYLREQAQAALAQAIMTEGNPDRAVALTDTIEDPYYRVEALTALMEVALMAGDTQLAESVLRRAENSAGDIEDQNWRARAMAYIAVASGQTAQAVAHTQAMTDQEHQVWVLTHLVQDAVDDGDIDSAELLIDGIGDRARQAWLLALLAEDAAYAGDPDRSALLSTRASALAEDVPGRSKQAEVLALLASAAARAGDIERAETFAYAIGSPREQARSLAHLAVHAEHAGNDERADELVGAISDLGERAEALTDMADAAAAVGHAHRARMLAEKAEKTARSAAQPKRTATVLRALAKSMARTGDFDRAAGIADAIPSSYKRANALTELAAVAVAVNRLQRARKLSRKAKEIAGLIDESQSQAEVLVKLAGVAILSGDAQQAVKLAREAGIVAASISDFRSQAETLAEAAKAASAAGNVKAAAVLAIKIADPSIRMRALTKIKHDAIATGDIGYTIKLSNQIEAAALALRDPISRAAKLTDLIQQAVIDGDTDRALRLREQAESAACSIQDPSVAVRALTKLIRRVSDVESGERILSLAQQAEVTARTISNPDAQAAALEDLAIAVGEIGYTDQADAITYSINDSYRQAKALGELAKLAWETGSPDRAVTLTISIGDPARRAEVLVELAHAAANSQGIEHAVSLCDQAKAAANTIADPGRRADVLTKLVEAVAACGRIEQARILAHRVEEEIHAFPHTFAQDRALPRLALAEWAAGDFDGAVRLVTSVSNLAQQVEVFIKLIQAETSSAESGHTMNLARRAREAIDQLADPDQQAKLLSKLAQVASIGNVEQTEEAAPPITSQGIRAETQADITKALVAAGIAVSAEVLVEENSNLYKQAKTLIEMAHMAANYNVAKRFIELSIRVEKEAALTESGPPPKELVAQEPSPDLERRIMARAFTVCHWVELLDELAQLEPAALTAINDEYFHITSNPKLSKHFRTSI